LNYQNKTMNSVADVRALRRLGPWLTALAVVWAAATPCLADLPTGVQRAEADGGLLEALIFYIVAIGTVVCGAGVCLSRSIVRMAVWLFGALGSVAVLYFLLAANFLGAIQLIVYAGGTLVLLIFGVMLTSKSPWVRFEIRTGELVWAGVVCVVLAGAFTALLSRSFATTLPNEVTGTNVHELGVSLLTTYLVPFEVASILLLVVMIGAAHLARQEKG
jgi:NADH:ubiquinone oxidoreductase subunit 6 (subunit J)